MAGQRHDGLHRPLAEAARPQKHGTPVILERTGHDLRGRSGAAVDQDHNRQAFGQITGAGVVALGILFDPAARRHDLAALQEGIGDGDGLVQQSARVVAQVEDETDQLVAQLLLDLGHRGFNARCRLLGEAGDPDIADAAVLDAVAHRLDPDDVTRDRDLEGFLVATLDGQLDVRADRTAHALDRLVEGQAEDRLRIQLDDQVTGLDAGAERRGVVDRRDHHDDAVLHRHLDAEPAERPAGLHLHVLEAVLVEIAGMGIECREHALDRRFHQLLVRDLLHVFGSDALEHRRKEVKLAVGVVAVRRLGQGERGRDKGHHNHGDPQCPSFHADPHRWAVINPWKGSMGRPNWRNS